MHIVKGSTTNETKMIMSIQAAISAVVDGAIGTQTMSDIACRLGADGFPLTLLIYGAPVIIANDLNVIASPGRGLGSFDNSMNGSFYTSYAGPSGIYYAPCSICVSKGEVKHPAACHASLGYPESVIYRLKKGMFGIARVKNVSELPPDLSWVVGGMGLLGSFDPDMEGFKKIGSQDFSDVLRDTNHAMLGIKNDHIYMVYCASKTAAEVNGLAKQLGLEKALMLDGGHIAGINGTESFAKVNNAITQHYVLQGI